MRLVDSQKNIFFNKFGKKQTFPARMASNDGISLSLKDLSFKVERVRLVAKRGSGNGWLTVVVTDESAKTLFSKTVRIRKASATEVSFDCEFRAEALTIKIFRPSASNGTVTLDRVILEGECESLPKKQFKAKESLIDYRKITERIKSNLRVAAIVPYGILGGAEVYLHSLLKANLSRISADIIFISGGDAKKYFSDSGFKCIRVNGTSGLKRHFEENGYNSILFYNSKKVYDALLSLKDSGKVVASLIEIYHSDFIWSDAISAHKERRRVDAIIRVSPALAEDISGVSESKKPVIPVPVRLIDDCNLGHSEIVPPDIKRGDYKAVIGMVTRLSPEKDVKYALLLAEMMQDHLFVIVGGGSKESDFRKMILELNLSNVLLLGHKKNVYDYYKQFDIFLLTSKFEGSPISIVEAMSFGLPVFTTPVGDIFRAYKNLDGVMFLSKDPVIDSASISGFNHRQFDGGGNISYVKQNHDLTVCKDLFFSAILNQAVESLCEDSGKNPLPGRYI